LSYFIYYFSFPTPVQFEEVDTNNVIVQSGINDTITFKVSNNLNIYGLVSDWIVNLLAQYIILWENELIIMYGIA
jgi:hypothetical protein